MQCVNPLYVGELISTTNEWYLSKYELCVNPLYVGELISTLSIRWVRFICALVCQSPSRRGTHFYCYRQGRYMWFPRCVNPLHVGELISTKETTNPVLQFVLCQSPSRRGTHFYRYKKRRTACDKCVSIPFTSGNSFLP